MIHGRQSLLLPCLSAFTVRVAAFAFMVAVLAIGMQAQTWTAVVNPLNLRAGTTILLTDGTVLVQQMTTSGNMVVPTGNWFRMIPDSNGGYINPVWSQISSMPSGYGPLYYGSAVLPDGRLVVVGGEFNLSNPAQVETNQGAIYDPSTNVWTSIAPPPGFSMIGDAASAVLPNGTFMLGDCCSSSQHLLNASNLTWTTTGSGKSDSNGEEGWTLLPNGKVLTIDTSNILNTETYNPSTGTWSSAGSTPVSLISGGEIGPAVLRPDGTVFAAGANSSSAIYNSSTGQWSTGPTFPSGLGVPDGPAALLPSGNVLVETSPANGSAGVVFFEFNGSILTQVANPPNIPSEKAFTGRLLVLPTGQILFTDSSTHMAVYSPAGTFQNAWRPVITSVSTSLTAGAQNNSISGMQFNGLSQGAGYGDDVQQATNFPLVRITNSSTGHVFYAKTHNHSTMAVATGGTIVSTQFDLPGNMEGGASTLQVVANGIPSSGTAVTVHNPATGILGFTGQFSCLDGQTCDTGTISVTVNTTTKTISYDGACSGAPPFGFSWAGNPCIPQTIVDTLVSAFNSDPNSPVTASSNMDTYAGSGAFDVVFTAKQTGPGGNYPTSLSVVSNYGNFQIFGDNGNLIRWSLTPFPQTGGVDPNTLTEITPLSGSMTGGH